MTLLRQLAGFTWRLLGLAAFVAVTLGLPLAVHMRTSLDVLYSGAMFAQRSGAAFVVSEPLEIGGWAPLKVLGGAIWGGDAGITTTGEKVPRLFADGLKLVLDASGATPSDPSAPTLASARLAPLLAQLADLNVERLALRQAQIDLLLPDMPLVRLENVNAEVTVGRNGRHAVKGLASHRGQRMSLEAAWSTPQAPAGGKGGETLPLKATLRGPLLDLMIDGVLTTGPQLQFDGRTELSSARLRLLAKWLGIAVSPRIRLTAASVSGPLQIGQGRLTLPSATVMLDGNRSTGALTATRSNGRPMLEGTLGFDKLDLARYMGRGSFVDILSATGLSASTAAAVLVPGVAVARPIEGRTREPLLTWLDADLRISAGKVVLPLVETGRGAVTLALKNGRLLADLAELEVESGTASGQVTLDHVGDGIRLVVRGKLGNVDPGRVLADAMKRNPLLGRADIVFEAATVGASLDDMLANASGRGSFTLAEGGGRLGLDLKALSYAASRQETAVSWAAAGRGGMAVDQLAGRFSLSAGNVAVDGLTARFGSIALTGSGSVDCGRQSLDLKLNMAPAGQAADAQKESRQEMWFKGDWFTPAITARKQTRATLGREGSRASVPRIIPAAATAP